MKRIIVLLAVAAIASTQANAQLFKSKKKKATQATKEVSVKAKEVVSDIKVAVPPPPPPPAMVPPPPPNMPQMQAPQVGNAMPQAPAAPQQPAVVYDFDKYLKVDKEKHDFGNIAQLPEGATATFTVTNTSNEEVSITNVQASCGCTVPNFDRTPIAPGKKGTFTAKYNSQGRPGAFTKSLTIQTTRGTHAVTITGNVESAPATSVPATPASPVMQGGH